MLLGHRTQILNIYNTTGLHTKYGDTSNSAAEYELLYYDYATVLHINYLTCLS